MASPGGRGDRAYAFPVLLSLRERKVITRSVMNTSVLNTSVLNTSVMNTEV